jgi:predicted site-specific integrase-resolvase
LARKSGAELSHEYGYARVSTGGQSVDAQVRQLTKAGCKKVFRKTASGAQTDRAQLRKALAALQADEVLMVTKLDRLGWRARRATFSTPLVRSPSARPVSSRWATTGRTPRPRTGG